MHEKSRELGAIRWPKHPFRALAHALVHEALDAGDRDRETVSRMLGMGECWIENVTRHSGNCLRDLPAWALVQMIADESLLGDDARFNLISQLAAQGGYVVARADAAPQHGGPADLALAIGASVGQVQQRVREAMADGRMSGEERDRIFDAARLASAELAEMVAAMGVGPGVGA